MLSPLESERSELGYKIEEIRPGRRLRVIHKCCEVSDVCVFFVHGGGGRAGQFKHQINALKAQVNIVAFDFLGHGDSPRINQTNLYTADEHLQDLIDIFRKYKKKKNMYISHSYGNIHVLRHLKLLHAKKTIHQIASVVMIGLGVNAPVSLGWAGKMPPFLLEWLRPLARAKSNATIFAPKTDPALIRFENTISDTNRMYTMRTIGLDCSNQMVWNGWLEDGRQAIVTAKIPCTIICGEEDGVFSTDSSRQLKERFQVSDDCFHVVKEAGHLPMLEKPEDVNIIVKKFICSNVDGLEYIHRSSSSICSESDVVKQHQRNRNRTQQDQRNVNGTLPAKN